MFYRMRKQAISVTLGADNLTWLRGRARAATCSVSETLDRLVESTRKGGAIGDVRSVAGTISIAPSDPDLRSADRLVRAIFTKSVGVSRGAGSRRLRRRVARRSRG
jgi:hypothetical protein